MSTQKLENIDDIIKNLHCVIDDNKQLIKSDDICKLMNCINSLEELFSDTEKKNESQPSWGGKRPPSA